MRYDPVPGLHLSRGDQVGQWVFDQARDGALEMTRPVLGLVTGIHDSGGRLGLELQ